MFLSDLNTADFSVKKYIQEELRNPQSAQIVQQPSFNPIASTKRKIGQVGTLAGIGTAKYIKDNKLNRRQRRQVDKWQNFLNPKPKQNFLSKMNPFRKKQTTNSTVVK
jgi:hypothetical protein